MIEQRQSRGPSALRGRWYAAWRARGQTIALVASFVAWLTAPSGPASAQGIAFADPKPIAPPWTSLAGSGVDVEIRNVTRQPLTVTLSVTQLRDSAGTPVAPPVSAFVSESVDLPPQAHGLVRLRASDGVLSPGRYRGVLVAAAGRDRAFAQQAVVVPAPPAQTSTSPAVTPRVSRWSVRRTRHCVWELLRGCGAHGGAGNGALLPVTVANGGTATPKPAAVQVSGVLTRSPEGAGHVTADSTDSSAISGLRAVLPLRFSNFDRAGEYSGVVRVSLPGDSSSVEMTVRVHDSWGLAALTIVAGLLVAFIAQSYTSVLRGAAVLEQRGWDLVSAAKNADAAFQSRVADSFLPAPMQAGVAAFSIAADAARIAQEVSTAARKLWRSPFTSLSPQNAAYTAELDRVTRAEKVILAWPTFADALIALAATLHGARAAAAEIGAPPAASPEPSLFGPIVAVLVGAPLPLDTVDARRTALGDAAASMTRWGRLAERLHDQWRVARALLALKGTPRLTDAEAATVEEKVVSLRAVRATLWDSQTVAELDERGAALKLVECETALGALRDRLRPPDGRPGVVLEGAPGLEAVAGDMRRLDELVSDRRRRGAVDGERRRRELMRFITVGDVAWLLVALFGALVAGLNSVYYDKSFGSWQSYLGAFTTGLVARGALDLLSGITRLFDRRAAAA